MNIENNPAHPSLAHALATRAAAQANAGQVAPPDGLGDPKTHPPKTDSTDATKAPPVTGVSRNVLSHEVLDQAIRAQEAGAQDAGALEADTYEGVLNDVNRRALEAIASDPKIAAERAEFSGTAWSGLLFSLSEVGVNSWGELNSNPEASRKLDAILARHARIVERDLELKKSLYETREAAGVPPAQIYADILKLGAGNSAFNDTYDRGLGAEEGFTARWIQAKADYLQGLIDRKAEASSVKVGGDPADAGG